MSGQDAVETAGEIVVRWGNLRRFFDELEKVGAQADDVESYAIEQVFNKSGFEYDLCVLQPLAAMMETLGGVFSDLRSTFDGHWEGLVTALALAGKEFEETDGGQVHRFLKPYLELVGED